MSSYNELVTILKELLFNRFYPKPEYIHALLGDGQGNVLVPDRPDYNYVRFNRSATEKFEVFNKEVSQPVDGWPVLVGILPWQPNLVQVVATDWAAYLQSGWGNEDASIQAHASTHEWPTFAPGSDAINTYIRAITPLRTQPAASGTASIYVTAYEYDGQTGTSQFWPGTPALSLSAAIPASGTQRYMGIYLNPVTNALGVVTGSLTTLAETIEPLRPAFPRGVYPTAYVRLYGMQAVVSERDIRDARRLWNNSLIYTGSLGPHNLLSQFHPDTVIGSVVAGDLIYGNSTPKWTRLPIISGSYLGSQAGTPAWTNVTQLAAPDGSPNPALTVTNAGDIVLTNDIYVESDKAGLKSRTVNAFQASITDHFDNGWIGWSWATYTGFVTPGNIDVTTHPSVVVLFNSAPQGAARAFAYQASASDSIHARVGVVIDTRIGVRLDDGTNNNYFEWFVERGNSASSPALRYRYANGGVVTGPTTVFTPTLVTFITMHIGKGGSITAYYIMDTPRRISTFAVASWFTTARSGIYYELLSGTPSLDRSAFVDWYKQT